MAQVAIISGSSSDSELVKVVEDTLREFDISFESSVISAHRNPDKCRQFATTAKEKGFKAVIAIAGLSAHLPGVIASMTELPVIGVPAQAGALNGLDALLSIVQMPGAVPVATMAIGKAGAKNSAIFCAQILALSDSEIAEKVAKFKKRLAEG